ncbi:unnamed protein product [Urochloa humidicola]
MAGSAVSAVAGNLGKLAGEEATFLCGVHDEVELLRDDLRTLQTFLADAHSGSGGDDALAADSIRRIRETETPRTKPRTSSTPRITWRLGTEGARACWAP